MATQISSLQPAVGITTNPFGGEAGASSDFWNLYIKGRPHLQESLLQRVWSYHTSKGGKFEVVHEPGAGVGVHSRRFAAKFSQIIISDIDKSNIDIAKQHLKDLSNAKFRVAKLEDIDDLPAEGVDMVIASNCVHFADHDQWLEALNYQLKPGGTYAYMIFCPSILVDERLQDIWVRLWWRGSEVLCAHTGHTPFTSPFMKRVITAGNAEALPLEIFEPGAIRLKIHHDEGWQFCFTPKEIHAQLKDQMDLLVNRIGETDQIVIVPEEESQDWTFEADLPRLKEMVDAFGPNMEDAEMERLWKEMEEELGGGTVKGKYLVGLIMATKRR